MTDLHNMRFATTIQGPCTLVKHSFKIRQARVLHVFFCSCSCHCSAGCEAVTLCIVSCPADVVAVLLHHHLSWERVHSTCSAVPSREAEQRFNAMTLEEVRAASNCRK